MSSYIFWLVFIGVIAFWLIHRGTKGSIKRGTPLYPLFRQTHFRPSRDSVTEYCPICDRPSTGLGEYRKSITICNSCLDLVYDRSVLRKLKVPEATAKACQGDHLVALNLIQIDLQRGNITEADADRFNKEVMRDIIESQSKYKKIKARLEQGRAKPWTFEETVGESVTCRVCNKSRYGVCKCRDKFGVAYSQGKIPPKMRAISEEARRLNRPELGFWFEDWLYLSLIADDLGNGIIDRDEAERESNNYINVAYEDSKRKLGQYKLSVPEAVTEEVRRNATATSQGFMDDILS